MSHVAVIDLQVLSIDALEEACQLLGLQLIRNKKNWRWFGHWADDYHAKEAAFNFGIDPKEYGNCAEHVITDPNNNSCYEIGVVRRRDGKPGYMLVYDFFAGGVGMSDKVGGQKAERLQQVYAAVKAKGDLKKKGFTGQIIEKDDKFFCVGKRKKRNTQSYGR